MRSRAHILAWILPLAGACDSHFDVITVESDSAAGDQILQSCVNPDLDKVMKDVTLTLCDGVVAHGRMELSPCIADGQQNCMASEAFPAVDSSRFGVADIAQGTVLAGVVGQASFGGLPPCQTDGDTNCRATDLIKPVALSSLHPGDIASGEIIGGVVGDYPSSVYPLAGTTATIDLTSPHFNATLTSGASFEWFDSAGIRYEATGNANLVAANVKDGITLFGVVGSNSGGSGSAACSSDGEVGCLTDSRFKAVDTDASVLTSYDLRAGKTAGGISGSLMFPNNMAQLSTFNLTAAPASSSIATADAFDSIDDDNAGGAMPGDAIAAWSPLTLSHWEMPASFDNGNGGGVSGDGLCNGTEVCAFRDRFTGIMWAKPTNATVNHSSAMNYCDGATFGGYTDWRLATEKEAFQAYINGIWGLKGANQLNLVSALYWTATTTSWYAATAWTVTLSDGLFSYNSKISAATARALCMRE